MSSKLAQIVDGAEKAAAEKKADKKDKKVYPPQPFEGTFFLAPFKTGKGQPMFTGNIRIERQAIEEMMNALQGNAAPAISVKCVAISAPTKNGQVINIFRDRGRQNGAEIQI